MAKNIILASDSAFFVKTVDVPASMSVADAEDFADTAAETMSPLPADRLRRGFFRRGSKMTVYTGLFERVFDGCPQSVVAGADLVIPASALLSRIHLPDGAYFFESEKSVAFIRISGGNWEDFCAAENSGNFEADFEKLRNFSEFDKSAPFKRLVLSNVSCSARGKLEFKISVSDSSEGAGGEIFGSAKKADLLTADLRDRRTMKKLESVKRKRAAVAVGVWAFPAIFCILFVWQIAHWVSAVSTASLEASLEKIAPAASEIERRSEELGKMFQFTSDKDTPLQMLALVNSLRPDNIAFLKAGTTAAKEIEIRGSAPTIAAANAYYNALSADKRVASANMKTEAGKGSARFSLTLKLK